MLGKELRWSRNLQEERQSLRAAQQKKVQQKAPKCQSTQAETATARGAAPSRSSSVHTRDPPLCYCGDRVECYVFNFGSRFPLFVTIFPVFNKEMFVFLTVCASVDAQQGPHDPKLSRHNKNSLNPLSLVSSLSRCSRPFICIPPLL